MDTMPDAAWQEQVQILLRAESAGRHVSEHAWLAIADGRPGAEDAADAVRHLARCDECREILRAIRALRAEAQAEQRLPSPSRRRWATGAGLATASLVAGLGTWLLVAPAPDRPGGARPDGDARSSVAPPEVVDTSPSRVASVPTAPPPEWLRVVPPAIALYSPGLLTMRGRDTASFADAFGEAMAPWQAGSYAEAALRLDTLARQYPDVAESQFYLGAAWLLTGVPGDAVAPLQRAVALAPSSLQADASWYLGLALVQTQRVDDAARMFRTGCTAGDARACRAAAHLDASRHTPRE